MSQNAHPVCKDFVLGLDFFDQKSGRQMKLVYCGPWQDWIVYKHADGQWVSIRKSTVQDWGALAETMSDEEWRKMTLAMKQARDTYKPPFKHD